MLVFSSKYSTFKKGKNLKRPLLNFTSEKYNKSIFIIHVKNILKVLKVLTVPN